MVGKLEFAQPVTRVHNLFRIRTVVNAVTEFNAKNKFPSDKEIAFILAKKGLSKLRKEKIKDRIMRRARDHLLTASYMGLLSRSGKPFGYWSTTAGAQLSKYSSDEECPKDATEEAILIDKIMRFKLTNIFDLQQKEQYAKLRSRPCLYILYILKSQNWLHEHQIAVALGAEKCDPTLADKKAKRTLLELVKYAGVNEKVLLEFYKDYGIDEELQKNMTRNVRPLLDWCESLGLVISSSLPNVRGRWYNLTDRGSKVLSIYQNKIPVWYLDLKAGAPYKASILLFYKFLRLRNLTAGLKLLSRRFKGGLVEVEVKDSLQELENTVHDLAFATDYSRLESDVDFTLDYDVPPEDAEMVKLLLRKLGQTYDLKVEEILEAIELDEIDGLRFSLERDYENIRKRETELFATKTATVSEPILSKVTSAIPSVGILSQYKSDFEKEAALFLRILDFNANKYQGQMADRCTKAYTIRFFENNPDILITNGIETLVECKSIGEWKAPLSDKSVPKEIMTYEQVIAEVKPNSVMIVYEGTLDTKSLSLITSILEDTPHVVFVTKNYLINCIYQPAKKERLREVLKYPEKFDKNSRILY
jgi:hypothetical protein